MRVLVFGVGGQARVVADIIAMEGKHDLVGLVSDTGRKGSLELGVDVVAGNDDFEDVLDRLQVEGAVIALGDNQVRRVLAKRIAPRLDFITTVHPKAVVASDVRLGRGTVVMAGAVINPGTEIGDHCIINTSASVDHDCRVGDYTHICPGVHVAGHVTIGRECLLGIGTVVIDHIRIGDGLKIRAGSVITGDLPAN